MTMPLEYRKRSDTKEILHYIAELLVKYLIKSGSYNLDEFHLPTTVPDRRHPQ